MIIRPNSELKPSIDNLVDEGYTEAEDIIGNNQYMLIEHDDTLVLFYRKDNGYQYVRYFQKQVITGTSRILLESAGCPSRLVDEVLSESVKPTSSINVMKEFIALYPCNMLVVGEVGIGKTYAVIWALNELLKERAIREFKFVEASTIRKEIIDNRWQYNFNINVKLLVIDDLGTETMVSDIKHENQDKRSMLLEIINDRYSTKNLSTLITSNFESLSQISARYGERFVSRLQRWGKIKVVDKQVKQERMKL